MSRLREQMLRVMQQKNFSQSTITNYLSRIHHLALYFHKSPDHLTRDQISDYIHYCITEKNCSMPLINQLISALKILYVYVLEREWHDIDFPRPRQEKRLPEVLSKEEMGRIIRFTRNLKHRTIIMLAYATGLRLSEIIHLKPSDIDSKRMQINVRQAKGHKDRNVMLSELLLEQLRVYWRAYKPCIYLFEGDREGLPISERTLGKFFKQTVKQAGINRHVTFHTLRHSFATHLVEDGVEIVVIQRLLGHSNLRTTSVYLHLQHYDINKVKSPLDTLNFLQ